MLIDTNCKLMSLHLNLSSQCLKLLHINRILITIQNTSELRRKLGIIGVRISWVTSHNLDLST